MSIQDLDPAELFYGDLPLVLCSAPPGYVPMVLAKLASRPVKNKYIPIVYVSSDGNVLDNIKELINFYEPAVEVITLPGWDCLPYDQFSPSGDIIAHRIVSLSAISARKQHEKPLVILVTVNAIVQRLISSQTIASNMLELKIGKSIGTNVLVDWLSSNGYVRDSVVRNRGEYAVRGGILDLFPAGFDEPVRLDFWGDELENLRSFDPNSQRTIKKLNAIKLLPINEVILTKETIARFRNQYIRNFGAVNGENTLYTAISEGRRHAGMEHWLPMFYDQLETLFDYCKGFHFLLDQHVRDAVSKRLEQVADYYEARKEINTDTLKQKNPYNPVEPVLSYLLQAEIEEKLVSAGTFTPFEIPENSGVRRYSLFARAGYDFSAERNRGNDIFAILSAHIDHLHARNIKVLIACWSEGSRTRLKQLLLDHRVAQVQEISDFTALESSVLKVVSLAVLKLDKGFETKQFALISEQDILGDRLIRRVRKKNASRFLSELSTLSEGDIVVHVDHGIGRFIGLKTLKITDNRHDCLELHYHNDDKLFVPIENIELLSRYGSKDSKVVLDKLGSASWQSRKARLKKNLLEMADQLIKIAAKRALQKIDPIPFPESLYDEFAAHFPYNETQDQLEAINAVIDDLQSGTTMDRLICGDVGFGKTEVALRAAFVTAMSGKQVAVVVPTTLLARQHYKTFLERFRSFPIKVSHLSRLVSRKELACVRKEINDGTVDIVIGTHALLGKTVTFKRLGLLIIDEEQHFGVKHKEKLKELRSDIHVLTLSATPIPRTLQLALTGIRELSLITTAPVDRMAVRTFVTKFDIFSIREALLREYYRGGQSFYVCPHVSDLKEQLEFLQEKVPELKVVVAHGKMSSGQLDDVMNAFYDGKYDVLLSTTIIESGLDIPNANTLIVHRADMFGLSQLYQLRGRVGRSKARAYALFILPREKILSQTAQKRLEVLQSLDSIGAGFQLASHDLDIRGAGNLLGDKQSGQIREIGFELYQQMLEETIAELKNTDVDTIHGSGKWSPEITTGTSVLIPETYVSDLQLRMSLYRKMAGLKNIEEINGFAAELIDRFGPLPSEVDQLLKIMFIKIQCLHTNIEKLDAGPKGMVISFRNNQFSNPSALLIWINKQGSLAKIRPDESIVLLKDWKNTQKRLKEVTEIVTRLAAMATAA